LRFTEDRWRKEDCFAKKRDVRRIGLRFCPQLRGLAYNTNYYPIGCGNESGWPWKVLSG